MQFHSFIDCFVLHTSRNPEAKGKAVDFGLSKLGETREYIRLKPTPSSFPVFSQLSRVRCTHHCIAVLFARANWDQHVVGTHRVCVCIKFSDHHHGILKQKRREEPQLTGDERVDPGQLQHSIILVNARKIYPGISEWLAVSKTKTSSGERGEEPISPHRLCSPDSETRRCQWIGLLHQCADAANDQSVLDRTCWVVWATVYWIKPPM